MGPGVSLAIPSGQAGIPPLTARARVFYTIPNGLTPLYVCQTSEPYHEGRDYSVEQPGLRSINWSPAPNSGRRIEGYGAVLALDPQTGKGNGNKMDDCYGGRQSWTT